MLKVHHNMSCSASFTLNSSLSPANAIHHSLTVRPTNYSAASAACLSVDVSSPDHNQKSFLYENKKAEIIADEKKFIVGTYARAPLVFSSGKGCKLYDVEGRVYLDLTSGIAVNALGHGDPDWVRAVTQQAALLTHVSNIYYSVPQIACSFAILELKPTKLQSSLQGSFKDFHTLIRSRPWSLLPSQIASMAEQWVL